MPRNSRSTAQYASVISLERSSRRRSRLTLAIGLGLGLALPPVLGAAADRLPAPAMQALERATGGAIGWRPAPPRLRLPEMIRENPGERRRLDLDGMTRR